MKKTIIFIACVLSFALVIAQKSEETLKLEKLNLRPVGAFNKLWWEIDKETGKVQINWHKRFKSEEKEPKCMAWAYLQAMQNVYGLNLEQVQFSHTARASHGSYVYFWQHINQIPPLGGGYTSVRL